MRSQQTAGLVGAGGLNQSFLARLPAVLEQLGPVKGPSLRVSRRIVNGLHAGFGVGDYRALASCGFIWIVAPENALDFITAELASAVALGGKTVVLCDALRDSLRPSPLRTAGARVVTLNCVPQSSERKFVAEGDTVAMTQVRKLLALDRRRLIELRPAAKPLYFAGDYMASQLLMPWIAGAAESFRAAGFSREEAVGAVEALGVRALRAYARAGDKAWNRSTAERSHRAIARDLETLRFTDTRLAALFSEGSDRMLRYFAKPVRKERLKALAQGSG